jgi:hypothetical protein
MLLRNTSRGKIAMGWDAVWQLALKQFGAEAVEIRIIILLAMALGATLILVGIKYAFRPAGPGFAAPPSERPARALAAPHTIVPAAPKATAKVAAQPFRARKPVIQPARKCAKHTISSHEAPRPSIRRGRTPSFTIAHAPYSPLPPRR